MEAETNFGVAFHLSFSAEDEMTCDPVEYMESDGNRPLNLETARQYPSPDLIRNAIATVLRFPNSSIDISVEGSHSKEVSNIKTISPRKPTEDSYNYNASEDNSRVKYIVYITQLHSEIEVANLMSRVEADSFVNDLPKCVSNLIYGDEALSSWSSAVTNLTFYSKYSPSDKLISILGSGGRADDSNALASPGPTVLQLNQSPSGQDIDYSLRLSDSAGGRSLKEYGEAHSRAAVVIQSNIRGYLSRKAVALLIAAANQNVMIATAGTIQGMYISTDDRTRQSICMFSGTICAWVIGYHTLSGVRVVSIGDTGHRSYILYLPPE